MSLPIFFLALPAGALADMVDRRRLLIATQCWMLLGAALLGIFTLIGLTGPWLLLGLTLVISLGAALTGPAWHAVVPEIVNRSQLASAITLRDLAFNLPRIIGPVLGGWIIAAYVVASRGVGVIFLINALSFSGVVCVLLCWRRATSGLNRSGPMRLASAIHEGWRYVARAETLRAILLRASIFIFCESALWATLPFLARHQFRASAIGFAFLMSCMGIGAISCGAAFSLLRRRVSLNHLISAATIVAAVMLLLLTQARNLSFACVLVLASGAAWLATITSFNISLLHSAPDWVRSRAVVIFQFIFFGCSAGGRAHWGELASRRVVPAALACSGVGLLIGQLVMWRCHVEVRDVDRTRS